MKASTGGTPRFPIPPPEPDTEKIRQKLLQKGVYPTPKIIHSLRKKELQKSLRKSERLLATQPTQPPTHSQKQAVAEEAHFQALKAEYKSFRNAINAKTKAKNGKGASMMGKPWERLDRLGLRELAGESWEYGGEKLKTEHLRELSDIMENERDRFRWLLDDDIELEDGWLVEEERDWAPPKRRTSDAEAIRFLVDRLCGTVLSVKDWKFSRIMKRSGLQFTEGQLLKIVEGLGDRGRWSHALSVVDWVYDSKELRRYKSRFVYTKLLAVLCKARRPREALQIFNLMRGDCHIYPDMAAYHGVAVALGQAGLLRELLNIIDCMKQKPSKKIKNMQRKSWDPVLQPDIVVYNAVLNACVPSRQWRGVSWVFEQLRKSGLKPNGATYGLSMEIEKLRKLPHAKPLEITFTGMILSAMEGGHINDCVSIFEQTKRCCAPHIGIINAMLKVYGQNDMFFEAKELFEEIKRANPGSDMCLNENVSYLRPDAYSYSSMLEASASALQWEYFEYVYTEMVLYGYKLDRHKHASLLVEASKAGKWHLLEHAFDTILEAGEVPHPSFFTEMVCQAIARDDNERAITIVNTVAYASFQISEQHWVNLFEENTERLSRFSLKELLDSLCHHDLAMEASVFNFLRALQSFCGAGSSRDLSNSIAKGELHPDCIKGLDGEGDINMDNAAANFIDHNSFEDPEVNNSDTINIFSVNHTSNSREKDADLEFVSGLSNYSFSENGGACMYMDIERLVDDLAADGSADCFDNRSPKYGKLHADDEFGFNAAMSEVGDSHEFNLPLPHEILETWKESRIKDGIFFPFQLDRDKELSL